MRNSLRLLIGAALLFVGAAPGAAAVTLPEKTDRYVNDFAEVLSPAEAASLATRLRELDRQTGNQVIVFSLDSLEGTTPEEITLRAAEAWKPGEAERDNGIVIGVFPSDRKARIEVGYGLEGAIPDATAASILRDRMIPRFAEGNWYAGLSAGVESLAAAAAGEYGAPGQRQGQDGRRSPILLLVPFVIVALWIGIFSTFKGRRTDEYSAKGARHGYGRRGYGGRHLLGAGLLGAALGSRRRGGGGGFGGLGGGGFGGFGGGGGGFGGGGASGGW